MYQKQRKTPDKEANGANQGARKKKKKKNKNGTNLKLAEAAKIREETNKIERIQKVDETKPGLLFVLQNRMFSYTNGANQRRAK